MKKKTFVDGLRNINGSDEERIRFLLIDISNNYHKRLGYVCSSDNYSYDEVVRIFSKQDAWNGNTATIKFLNDASWNAAKSELLSDDARLLTYAFWEAVGYRPHFRYWVNNDVKVINIAIR